MINHYDLNLKLTKNFTLGEWFNSNHVEPAELLRRACLQSNSDEIFTNIVKMAERLQVIRDFYDAPLIITSGYRDPNLNEMVGGSKNSSHLNGSAVDIVCNDVSSDELQEAFVYWSGGMGMAKSYTHLDIGPKRRWSY